MSRPPISGGESDKYKEGRETYFFGRYQHQRASGRIYQRYRINSLELDLLSMLSAFCAQEGRTIVSKNTFFGQCTGNNRRKARMEGYLTGLRTKGFVGSYEYMGSPDSLSIGISKLGQRCLTDFWQDLYELMYAKPIKSTTDKSVIAIEGVDIKRHKVKRAA